MSSETLRRAAALMRERFEHEDVEDVEEAEFYLAVADLLDRLTCSCHPADDDSGHCVPREALVVARAYLGEQS